MQIVDFCFRKILTHEWGEEERVPSVRELGAFLQVNPNTAMRAFEYMQTEEIIYLKRGTGYYIQAGALDKILKLQKIEFFSETLPGTFQAMKLLGITINEVIDEFKKLNTERL